MSRLITLMIVTTTCSPAMPEWETHVYGPHAFVAIGETDQVPESSGVIASRTSPDVFWTHNDSGAYAPRVWAFRLSEADKTSGVARNLGYVELSGAILSDWEDIAAGPDQTFYVFNGGDNPPCDRTDKTIYRFAEPVVDPAGAPVAMTLPCDSLRFEYPDMNDPSLPADSDDERYDAECCFVHPTTDDVYIVTKRRNDGTVSARVYRLPGERIVWNSPAIHLLESVADISSQVPSWVTGGDIDNAGRRIVLRSYFAAYEFTLPDGKPFDAIFDQTPNVISLAGELQGEGICYAAGGGDLVSTSEVISVGPTTFPVFVTPWQLANARAEAIGLTTATICRETAVAPGSEVYYGETTTGSRRVRAGPIINSIPTARNKMGHDSQWSHLVRAMMRVSANYYTNGCLNAP